MERDHLGDRNLKGLKWTSSKHILVVKTKLNSIWKVSNLRHCDECDESSCSVRTGNFLKQFSEHQHIQEGVTVGRNVAAIIFTWSQIRFSARTLANLSFHVFPQVL
jgi:hypothetical protein